MKFLKNILSIIALVAFNISSAADASTPLDYVSTLVGTQSKHSLSTGNTYPAIAMPWGMNFWTAQTGENNDGWMYTYDADKICGLRQTHQPSPWINDYGRFSIMPVTGKIVFDPKKRASWFSHKAETARPNYYSVYLADYDVTAELTPTDRAALIRFTFPENDLSTIVIDAFDEGSSVTIIPERNAVAGYTTRNDGGVPDNFRNYFEIVFDKPFTYYATVKNGKIKDFRPSITSNHAGGIVGFSTKKGETVTARVASSFISPEQASQNLLELGDGDFDRIRQQGADRWNEVLGRFDIQDDVDIHNVDRLRTFYSCLYRCLLFPRSFYEIDKSGKILHYSPYDGKIHDGYMFTDTGFWDTFRALMPLLNLMYPEQSAKIQSGLANAYREGGILPEWSSPGHRDCMVGNNSASVVADAWLKGIRTTDDDTETLWEAVVHGTDTVHPEVSSSGRYGHQYYNTLGYVPCDKIDESAARTLEYAYDDWCIYQLGKSLGKSEAEIAPFKQRALNYHNLYDSESRLMRGRNKDGSFQSPFNPLKWGDAFTEGNSWHYTWSVFHDIQGLINLMGGKDRFNEMLDSVFTQPPLFDESYYGSVIHEIREMQIMNMGNYAHGNQPAQHVAYLYNYSGRPWQTQYWVREVMDKMYTPAPDGYCGDEDNGQTSAWYVFSALGMYPVCPGSGQYVIGSPLFKKVVLNLDNGTKVDVSAPGNSANNRYIRSIKLNGTDYDLNYLNHDVLKQGATIEFEMTDTPNHTRGITPSAAPYSLSSSE